MAWSLLPANNMKDLNYGFSARCSIRRAAVSFLAAIPLLISACATSYQSKGLTGGFTDFRLDANTYRVTFEGNGHTSRQTVETYLLYRCAELTAQSGYDYFLTINSDTEARHNVVTTPGSYNSNTTGYASGFGNMAYGSATTRGTFSPGQSFVHTKYGASAVIKVFKGDKPGDNPNAYNANEVLKYLGSQVKATGNEQVKIDTPSIEIPRAERKLEPTTEIKPVELQATVTPKIEAVKRYATLLHTKGPTRTIPPQTLRVEYADTGEGHGSARVIYPGNATLNGEYRTLASGQSFKGQVNAKLLDPDKTGNFPNSSLAALRPSRAAMARSWNASMLLQSLAATVWVHV